MRMWMVDPKYMCRKHLLGEHLEIHMFVNTIRMGISIKGYIKNNLLEPLSLYARHNDIEKEMTKREYKHKTELNHKIVKEAINKLSPEDRKHKIDSNESLKELLIRCSECRERY